MSLNREMSKRLLRIRNTLNLTQEEIAQKIGISRTLYIGYESGQDPVSKRSLDKIISNLNINQDWLFESKGEMFIGGNSIIEKQVSVSEPMSPSYSNATIAQLINQNNALVQQVSDLIKMQLLNAESIRNLTAHNVDYQEKEINSG